MPIYFGLVHQKGVSAYGVRFPDVPGCFSAADAPQDLISKSIEALALHLEGEALPDARTLGAVKQDPDVSDQLNKGAFLVAVPFV